jgi:hypothetical protein
MVSIFDRRLWYAGGCVVLLGMLACGDGQDRTTTRDNPAAQCGVEVRRIAEDFAGRMRLVSVLGPDSVVSRELTAAYQSLVTPELLSSWKESPAGAPGREVSNPWPARVEITSIEPDGAECQVEGRLIFVTTADTLSAVEQRPVTIRLRNEGGWKVSAFTSAGRSSATASDRSATSQSPSASDESISPSQVIRRYYDAIQRRDFGAAYGLWSDSGRASGQSPQEFARGFAQTVRVQATIADSVGIQGAAGSQYATVPVAIDAQLRNGRVQHFTGTYVLRRSMVDGATPSQRQWHIYSASVRPR